MIDCNDSWDMALNLSKNAPESSQTHGVNVVWNLSLKNHQSQYSLMGNIQRNASPAVNSPDSTTTDEAEYSGNFTTSSPVRCEYENEDSNLDSLNSLWLTHFQSDLSSPTLLQTTNQLSRFAPYNVQKKCHNVELSEKDLPVTPRKRRKQLKPVRVINRTYVISSSDLRAPSSSRSSSPFQGTPISIPAPKDTDEDVLNLSTMETKSPSSPWEPGSVPSVTCPYCDTAVQLMSFAHHLQTHHALQIGAQSTETEARKSYSPTSTNSPGSISFDTRLLENQEKAPGQYTNYEAYCKICDKEFCNKFFLRKHKEKQHGISSKELISPSLTSALDLSNSYASYFKAISAPPTTPMSSRELNPLEGIQNVKSRGSLGQLQTEVNAGDGNGNTDDDHSRPMHVRNYCKICDKELCNKYFLKRHMLKMHSIDLGSTPKIGGVTCDVCHKELCSKYFLKVHKQNAHGICEEIKAEAQTASTVKNPFVSFC